MRRPLPLIWRMSLPTLLVSLLLLTVGLVAAALVYRSNADVSQRLDKQIDDLLKAEELLLAVRDMRNAIERHTASPSPALRRTAGEAHKQAASLLEQLDSERQQKPLLDQVRRRLKADAAYLATLAELDDSGRVAGRDAINTLSVPAAQRLLESNRNQLGIGNAAIQRASNWVGTGLAFLAVCGAAAGLVAGLGVASSIARSIEAIGGSVRTLSASLAEGDDASDATHELRELLHTMGKVQERTEGMVTELQRTRATAARADQLAAVGQLAAGIAHELRNPLTAIKLLADNATENHDTLSPGELGVVRDEAERMQQMLQTFLDFARPPRLIQEAIDLAEEVRQTVEIVRPRAERVDVDLHAWLDPHLATRADRQQLRQVLLNLLINAVDAQPEGGRIDIEARRRSPDAIEVSVSDAGAGIDAAILPRLFEPFASSKETGIGLGLAVSYRIVASHGGALTGENLPDGGARFRFNLPALEPATNPAPEAPR